MIQIVMLSTCSRCGRQEAVTCWTSAGEKLTAVLPVRWRELAGGVVCDRCDRGAPANVVYIRKHACDPSASMLADTPATHLCTPRGSIPPELRVA